MGSSMQDARSKSSLPGQQADGSWILDRGLDEPIYGTPAVRGVGLTGALVSRYNPYHDEKGLFTTSDGAASGSDSGGGRDTTGGRVAAGHVGATRGPALEADLPIYDQSLKGARAGGLHPMGDVVTNEDGTLTLSAPDRYGKDTIARLGEVGVTFDGTVKQFDELLGESDPAGGTWYYDRFEEQRAFAEQLGVDQSVVAGMVAAMSPQTPWDEMRKSPSGVKYLAHPNWVEVKRLALALQNDADMLEMRDVVGEDGKKYARPTGNIIPASEMSVEQLAMARYAGSARENKSSKYGFAMGGLRENTVKAIRIFKGEDPAKVLAEGGGSGQKVRSFYSNMMRPNDSDAVTIDGVMAGASARGANLDAGKVIGGDYRYDFHVQAVRYVAEKHGIPPHEAQSRIWHAWRKRMDENGTARTARKATDRQAERAAKAKGRAKGRKK